MVTNNIKQKVYKIVALIPYGKVSKYKKVAGLAQITNPRLVGYLLHLNKNPKKTPCHRVIRSDGTLASNYAFGGKTIQKNILRGEGVRFRGEKVIPKYIWPPSTASLL